jgi:GH18 family chitinase
LPFLKDFKFIPQLNLAVSFAGYSWESKGFPLLIDDGTMDDDDGAKSEYGMWRAARTPFKGSVLRWRKIETKFNKSQTIFDEKAMAPYIYDRANGLFFGFENERSILAKVQ